MSEPGAKTARLLCLGLAVALSGTGCSLVGGPNRALGGRLAEAYDFSGATFTVGSKESTEQLVLGHITVLALQATGASVNSRMGLEGGDAARRALTSGHIDMYWEYTGTAWITHLGGDGPIADPREQYVEVAVRDLEEHRIRWLEPARFSNRHALAVRAGAVDGLGVRTLSDLAGLLQADPLAATLCVGSDFSTGAEGLPGLERHYGVEFPRETINVVQEAVVYDHVDRGDPCNFGSVVATDERIAALGLFLLGDDRNFFPDSSPALNVREDVFLEHPTLAELFTDISVALDEAAITRLNAEVDVEGRLPEDVAERWLRDAGFIG